MTQTLTPETMDLAVNLMAQGMPETEAIATAIELVEIADALALCAVDA